MSFYNNYVYMCNKVNKSPSAVAEEMGYQRSVITRWSKGTAPRQATLQRVADYFGCSVADLTAEKEKKPAPESGPNKDMLLRWIETASRDELIEALQAVTKKLSEK